MNTPPRSIFPFRSPFQTSIPRPAPVARALPELARREYVERDFGIGYGRSSGYASPRRYASAWNGQPRFRCV
ncbi:hypothetical protein [Cognatiluteimonas telluris]|uniref:hypothetical protein n=1 Tax=Cognatiluteimonas telluris TaxID=1104775 RepID=UPI00140A2B9B|nr:hypothetical protein [Lysobacter telluris]